MKPLTRLDPKKMRLPATKGDIATAVIQLRSVLIHLRSIDLALAEGDKQQIIERLRGYIEHDDALMQWLQLLVGMDDG